MQHAPVGGCGQGLGVHVEPGPWLVVLPEQAPAMPVVAQRPVVGSQQAWVGQLFGKHERARTLEGCPGAAGLGARDVQAAVESLQHAPWPQRKRCTSSRALVHAVRATVRRR